MGDLNEVTNAVRRKQQSHSARSLISFLMGDLNEGTIALRQTITISVLVAYVILFMANLYE